MEKLNLREIYLQMMVGEDIAWMNSFNSSKTWPLFFKKKKNYLCKKIFFSFSPGQYLKK